MQFRLILWLLALRLRWLGRHHDGFRQQLQNRDIVMQWRTRAGEPCRWFHFSPEGVTSASALHPAPTVTLSFEDAAYAFRILKQSASNQMAFMEGMQQQRIRIEGDPGHLMWFMSQMKLLAPARRRRRG